MQENFSKMLSGSRILVTGSAGFIGFHTARKLLESGARVIGVDSFNDYYDTHLKDKRNEILSSYEGYIFYKHDISNYVDMEKIFSDEKPDFVIHLAAQAGIRYSKVNPWSYEKNNILGTMNIFECSVKHNVKKILYASSSSVYGDNLKIPFSESDRADTPISVYAASKKSCELMAYSYSNQSNIPFIGFRFFTVYGPFGRPDMAVFKFAKSISLGKQITLFGNGEMKRDYTYVDDIVSGVISAICTEQSKGPVVYNLGNSNPKKTSELVSGLEKNLGKRADVLLKDSHDGELMTTYADITKARDELGFSPKTSFEEGIRIFCKWFSENEQWIKELRD